MRKENNVRKIALIIMVLLTVFSFSSCENTSEDSNVQDGENCGLSHSHTEVIDEAVEPTCGSVGYTEGKHCSTCGEILSQQEEIPMTECEKTYFGVAKPASKTQNGIMGRICADCGKVTEETIIYAGSQNIRYELNDDDSYCVSYINSDYNDGDIVIPTKYLDKTIDSIGSFVLNNSIESLTITKEIINIAEDAFFSGRYIGEGINKTKSLSAFIVDNDNPNYKSIDGNLYSKDGKTFIRYAPAKTDTEFRVPDGVTTIAKNAFEESDNLRYIYLSDDVEYIDENAFGGCGNLIEVIMGQNVNTVCDGVFSCCEKLQKVSFPNSVTHIGNYAFQHCHSLTSVELPHGLTKLSDGMFWECFALENIIVPDTVLSIGKTCFIGCYVLENINIPEGVASIGESAFYSCEGLKSIYIPRGLVDIGDYVFYDCRSLERFVVDSNNPCYESIDGHLYQKENRTLLNYAIGNGNTEFTIPDGVVAIGYRAFFNCDILEQITIPNSVTDLGEGAFENCDKLKKVVVGDGVNEISANAFSVCGSLAEIYLSASLKVIGEYTFNWCGDLMSIHFSGTIEQWCAVEKQRHFDDLTPVYTVHCTNGDIDKNVRSTV